jgi:hypothetical protein
VTSREERMEASLFSILDSLLKGDVLQVPETASYSLGSYTTLDFMSSPDAHLGLLSSPEWKSGRCIGQEEECLD